jgi:hypothetical protein
MVYNFQTGSNKMKLFTEYETVTQNLPDIDAAINVLPNITL